jgi:RNA polymerase sigma factor (sigma-70 family)
VGSADTTALFEVLERLDRGRTLDMDLSGRHELLRSALTHARGLSAFLRAGLRNASDAQDLMQELYLRVLKIPADHDVRQPRAYLFAMAANLAWQHRERQKSEPLRVSLDELPGPLLKSGHGDAEASPPEAEAILSERLESLAQRLGQLPPKIRQSVLWHHRDGYTCDEVAMRLKVSTPCAKKYLVRGLARCREGAQ